MLKDQLRARGISNERVLNAMDKIPRENFVPEDQCSRAYQDAPLGIGEGQTISQPYIVAYMLEALNPQPDERLLDVGSGSGYAAAVASCLFAEVIGVERVESLYRKSKQVVQNLGLSNLKLLYGDATSLDFEDESFDAIQIAAASNEVPPRLLKLLKVGGRMILPLEETGADFQTLVLVKKTRQESFESTKLLPVRFVPLIREEP